MPETHTRTSRKVYPQDIPNPHSLAITCHSLWRRSSLPSSPHSCRSWRQILHMGDVSTKKMGPKKFMLLLHCCPTKIINFDHFNETFGRSLILRDRKNTFRLAGLMPESKGSSSSTNTNSKWTKLENWLKQVWVWGGGASFWIMINDNACCLLRSKSIYFPDRSHSMILASHGTNGCPHLNQELKHLAAWWDVWGTTKRIVELLTLHIHH